MLAKKLASWVVDFASLRETKKIPLKLGGFKINLNPIKQQLIPSQS